MNHRCQGERSRWPYEVASARSAHGLTPEEKMMQWTDLQALAPVPDCGPDFNACLDAFPDLHALRNTPQSARWHAEGDCWIHTQLVVRALIDGTDYAALPRREGCYDRPRAFADAHTAVSYFRGANVHPDFPLYPESGS